MPVVSQKSSNTGEVNSPALSIRITFIGELGNWDRNRRICVSSLEKTKFLVEISETCDHLVEEKMITRKYRNGPLGGSMGPQTSTFNCAKNSGIFKIFFDVGWRVISLP